MNPQLEIAILSAASALLGSIVGGLLSYLTTRHLKRQEWQQIQLEEQIAKREDLYSAFLTEWSRILFGAFQTYQFLQRQMQADFHRNPRRLSVAISCWVSWDGAIGCALFQIRFRITGILPARMP